MIELAVPSSASRELVDVTDQVVRAVAELGLRDGAVLVSSPHTTAGVIVNEGYDPEVVGDLVRRLERLAPREGQGDRHDEGNSDAHIVVALVGSSVVLPIADGGLSLGRWQRVFLVEWDGPRARRLHVSRV
ncbi:MAG: secondary thiamine-phosphate synthase enzyme YjbQ [Gaiellales bacterium]